MQLTSVYAIAAATSLALAGPALAQEEPQGEDDAGIGSIVVTAQKREQNVQDVPIAITALSEKFLDARDITSIDDLGAIAPNVKIEQTPGSATAAQVAIRGSVTGNPAVTWEPAVGIYLDGVYIAKNLGAIFDVADLERVEVLRGPQGTLYGRNTLAGAINLITAAPTGELGGKAELSYGNFDYRRAKATLDLPAFGPVSIKLSGMIAQRDGFHDIVPNPVPAAAFFASPPSASDAHSLDSKSALARVRIEPTSNLTIDYLFDYADYDQRPLPGQLFGLDLTGGPTDIFDPTSPAFSGLPLQAFVKRERSGDLSLDAPLVERTRTFGHALTATLDLGDYELKSITAFRDLRFEDALDLDGSPISIARLARFTDMDSFSQEVQLTGSLLKERLRFVLGGFYYSEDAATINPQTFFGVFGPFATRYDSRYASTAKAWAAYAQAEAKLTDELTLAIGGRYTKERKQISRFLQILSDPAIPPVALPLTVVDVGFGDVDAARYNDFSPTATLTYAFDPDINVYARYARGFKSGGFNGETNAFAPPSPDCPSGALELCNPYLAEKLDSYEVGFKSALFNGVLVLNLAAFWDEHRDIQLAVFDATGAAASKVLNAASARVRGFEIETVIRPSDALTINGSFAFLDSKYKKFRDKGIDVADNRALTHAPKYSLNLGADWRAFDRGWGRLNLIADFNMVSSYYTFPFQLRLTDPSAGVAGDSRSKGRVIANLRATLSRLALGSSRLSVSAWVRNLTQEDKASNFIDFGPTFGGMLIAYFPEPRTYGLTLGVGF